MIEIWTAIEGVLKNTAPAMYDGLNTGINEADITNLQAVINAKLPVDFVDFYKQHNGQSPDAAGLIACEQLLSFDAIISQWNIWKRLLDSHTFAENDKDFVGMPDHGVKNNWWNALWIPITHDGGGNHFCLDLDPAIGGSYGQIIRMWHDNPKRPLIANSFKAWISDYSDKLVSGQFVYSEDYFGIINKDDI
jgi:cell wall assembly regulator SMI1